MDTHSEPVSETPAVEQIPDAFEANSFEAALNAAFSNLDASSKEPEPVKEESVEPEPEQEYATSAAEVESEQDPLEQLTEEVDWTPKAANRFKQLKEELKGSRSELDQLRQLSKEQESKLQELSAIAENKDIEQLQSRIAEYEQEKMFTNLEQTTA